MNTNKKETSNYLKRLAYLGALLFIVIVPRVTDYFSHKPKLWYDPNVAETGKFLSTEEKFYVTDEDQTHMGDRYLLSCELLHTPEETKNGYMYSFVDDIRQDDRKFMLISDELLPTGKYLQLDGLVSGYYLEKYKNKGGLAGKYYTVLKVTNIKKSGENRIDFAAPLERTEEPNCSVSQNGITFSLHKIEYVLVGTAGLPACYNRICDIGAETFYSFKAEADIAFLIDREMGI